MGPDADGVEPPSADGDDSTSPGTPSLDLTAPILDEKQSRSLLLALLSGTVSIGTGTARGVLRAGWLLARLPCDGLKSATFASLEVGRMVVEQGLLAVARDVGLQSRTDSGREVVLSSVRTILSTIQHLFVLLELSTATCAAVYTTVLDLQVQWMMTSLIVLDTIFGSGESSDALRSMLSFLVREFRNPASGMPGERLNTKELLVAFFSLAILRVRCSALDAREKASLGVEQLIWDATILDRDVSADQFHEVIQGRPQDLGSMSDGELAGILELDKDDQVARASQLIASSIPPDAEVRLSSVTNVTHSINATVLSRQPFKPELPPGARLLELGWVDGTQDSDDGNQAGSRNMYRAVLRFDVVDQTEEPIPNPATPTRFQLLVESTEDAALERVGGGDRGRLLDSNEKDRRDETDDTRDESDDDLLMMGKANGEHEPPPVPPKEFSKPTPVYGTSIPSPAPLVPSTANQKILRTAAHPAVAKTQPSVLRPQREEAGSSEKTKIPRANRSTTVQGAEKKGGFRAVFRKGLLNRDDSKSPTSQAGPGKTSPPGSTKPRATSTTDKPLWRGPGSKGAALPTPAERKPLLPPRREAPSGPPRPTQKFAAPLTAQNLQALDSSRTILKTQSRPDNHRGGQEDRSSRQPRVSFETSLTSALPAASRAERGSIRSSLIMSRLDGESLRPSSRADAESILSAASNATNASIFTLKSVNSMTALAIRASDYEEAHGLSELRRTGVGRNMYPRLPLPHLMARYMRFSSAAYGSRLCKMLGMVKSIPPLRNLTTPEEVRSFAHHTGIRVEDVLLTSFADAQGGTNATGSTNTNVPLVHYVALDHKAKAVVLACRGTLDYQDILTDMACAYDDLHWRGRTYKVHKGIHASARRLLYGQDGRVLQCLKGALESNPDYGLVLCGHSLGGGVTALLGVLLSEPSPVGPFITAAATPLIGSSTTTTTTTTDDAATTAPRTTASGTDLLPPVSLPAGRLIHVFAYGPPGTMCPSLRRKTRGLITSVVYGEDIVPGLSLGVLHDFQTAALAFKTDNSQATSEFWTRHGRILCSNVLSAFTGRERDPDADELDDDTQWAWATLKLARANMLSDKLVPPGDVLHVSYEDAVMRSTSGGDDGGATTVRVQPAKRVALAHVRDVERMFSEVGMGRRVLTDHIPSNYEWALDLLEQGLGFPADGSGARM